MIKACTQCDGAKSDDEFYWKVKGVIRQSACKACEAVRKKQYYEANREKRKQYLEANREAILKQQKPYRASNPQLAGTTYALKRTSLTPQDLFCGATRADVNTEIKFDYVLRDLLTEKTGIQYHVDHIKPLCEGGVHRMWNLAVVTDQVNMKKGPMWFSEDHLTDEDIEAADAAILSIS
jgi:5-methylcytosine-specific restriction endonuclease McrA